MAEADPAVRLGGRRFQQYLAAKSHNSFAIVWEMKYSLLHNTAWQNNGRQCGFISQNIAFRIAQNHGEYSHFL